MSSHENAGFATGLTTASDPALGKARKRKARRSRRLLSAAVVILVLAVIAMTALIVATLMSEDSRVPLTKSERDVALHKEAVRKAPEDFEARTKLAAAYLQAGDPEKAIAEADRALALDGRALGAILVMGSAHLQLRQLDKAERDYLALLRVSSNHQTARTRLAQIYLEKKDLKKAAEQLDVAIERAPVAADLLVLRGVVYELERDEKMARDVYARALKLIPGYSLAVEGLGRLDRGEPVNPASFFGTADGGNGQGGG